MDEQRIEQEIQDKELTAPRLTPEYINSRIKSVQYHVFGVVTVACLTLRNGFSVIGNSAPASPENFNVKLGQKIAYDEARNKIWELEGYLLREKLSKEPK